jgi:hypothetical protein
MWILALSHQLSSVMKPELGPEPHYFHCWSQSSINMYKYLGFSA